MITFSNIGKPLVIAEIGINHFGKLDRAKRMVDELVKCEVDIIKTQIHIPDFEMSAEANQFKVDYLNGTIFDLISECALSLDDEVRLKEYVDSSGIQYLSTPFSREAANFLFDIGVDAFKIGSGECNNYPLLSHVAQFKKPIILSTGMNGIETVKKSTLIFDKHGVDYALLHTTNIYPTPHNLVRLGAMVEMMKEFPGVAIGLSDHTTDNDACVAAVALGAKILERHFTLDRGDAGPDIANSMDPRDARQLVNSVRNVYSMLGGSKGAVVEESPVAEFAFASVVALRDIDPGEILDETNIWVKRPGGGDFGPDSYESLLGLRTKRRIQFNHQLSRLDLDN